MKSLKKFTVLVRQYSVPVAWIISLVATVESLFFSEIMHIPACSLCWYQRIFMYPLVVVLGIGIVRNDKKVHTYALPLAVVGLLIAAYHNLLYYGLISERFAPCTTGVSCAAPTPTFFGMSIPFLSFLAFCLITISLVLGRRSE